MSACVYERSMCMFVCMLLCLRMCVIEYMCMYSCVYVYVCVIHTEYTLFINKKMLTKYMLGSKFNLSLYTVYLFYT